MRRERITRNSRRSGPDHGGRRAGFSIVEISFYVAILAIVSAPIVMSMLTVSDSTVEVSLVSRLLERSRVAAHRVGMDVRQGLASTLVVESTGRELRIEVPRAFNGSTPDAIETVSYVLSPSSDDPINGSDDDGDGLTDEVTLVRAVRETGERQIILDNVIGERSSFVRNAAGAIVTLAAGGRREDHGEVAVEIRRFEVVPRN